MLFRTRSNVLFKWDCYKKKQNTPGGCLSLIGRVLFFRIANRRKLEDDCLSTCSSLITEDSAFPYFISLKSLLAFAGYEKRRSVSVHQAPLLSMLKV